MPLEDFCLDFLDLPFDAAQLATSPCKANRASTGEFAWSSCSAMIADPTPPTPCALTMPYLETDETSRKLLEERHNVSLSQPFPH
jgi:hypothetical protein